jgi:predicted  nucleic acid-binding Zn-ribbon protein
MKNRELRSSLIKSGIILILSIFFIYSFAVDDSGGVTGTIASIFTGILFLIGLALAIVVSVLVMFGIYFGILYMYNRDICKQTYDEFTVKVTELAKSLNCSCGSKCFSSKTVAPPISDEDLKPLRNYQDKLGSQLSNLQNSVASLEKTLNTVSSSVSVTTDGIANLDNRANSVEEELKNKAGTDSINEATKKLTSDITTLQSSLKPLADKVSGLETSLSTLSSEEDDTDRELQETLDSSISGIKDELTTMKKAIEDISNLSPKKTKVTEETNHRILSYFTKKSDEENFIALVTEAIGKDMTYAQVGEFLNDSLSAEASEIIAEHPSLTKDYIRVCRQKD